MIELLVRYFESAGFKVKCHAFKMHHNDNEDVEEVSIEQADSITLAIRKQVGERIIGYSWGLSDYELQLARDPAVFVQQADRILAQLNEAIEKEGKTA